MRYGLLTAGARDAKCVAGDVERGAPKAEDEFAPLVRSIAGKLRVQLDLVHDVDDLVSAGFLGLVEARARFDPSRGVQFATFAYYRIRGAIIDFVRKSGPLSRRAYDRVRLAEGADLVAEEIGELRAGDPRSRTDAGGTVRAIDDALGRITASFVIGCLGQDEEPEDPETELIGRAARTRVRRAIDALPERERAIIVGHYVEGRRFDEIAAELGVSKSWTSRIHSKALDLLRASLSED